MLSSIRPWAFLQRWPTAAGLALLTGMAALAFLPRLAQLTLRGEETRRARVAWEMLDRNDFLVPRVQDEVYTSRPPLGNWLIAGAGWLRGRVDLWAARMPSLLATGMTAWLIYIYARAFLPSWSAIIASLAFLSTWKVLELGRLAETEAVLTLLVGASLLVWHWGYARRWPTALFWSLGYSLAALAALAKGLQGPFYFVAATSIYLLVKRDPARLFCFGHFCGAALAMLIIGAWWGPYVNEVGLASGLAIWWHNVQIRFEVTTTADLLEHIVSYPFIVFLSMMPWAPLLLAFARPEFRRTLDRLADPALFQGICLTVALASCWLAVEARSRYVLPLAPCASVLVGIVADRAGRAFAQPDYRSIWREFTLGFSILTLALAVATVIASWTGWLDHLPLFQPRITSLVGLAAALGATYANRSWQRAPSPRAHLSNAILIALVTIAVYDGPWMNWLLRRAERTAEAVADVKAQIPEGTRFVSFGPLHHAFLYYYQAPLPQLPWPKRQVSVPADVEYFCFHETRLPAEPLPFAWEKVAEISCDRHRREVPFDRVIVGRRWTPRVANARPRGSS